MTATYRLRRKKADNAELIFLTPPDAESGGDRHENSGECAVVIMAGYLLSIRLIEPFRRSVYFHVVFRKKESICFGYLECEIGTENAAAAAFSGIGGTDKNGVGRFFRRLSGELQKKTDFLFADEFERLLTFYFSAVFSTEEKLLFLQVGRNLLSDDLLFHQDTARQLSEKIQTHVLQMKECVDKQKKVCQALCLSASGLLVIVLL